MSEAKTPDVAVKARPRMIYIRERLKELRKERSMLQDEMKSLKGTLKPGKGGGANRPANKAGKEEDS